MHATTAGEKRKALKREAVELEREAKALAKLARWSPLEGSGRRRRIGSRRRLRTSRIRPSLRTCIFWQMEKEKTTKKGSRTYAYWMASWREGR